MARKTTRIQKQLRSKPQKTFSKDCDAFFNTQKVALTFDDVRLRTGYSSVMPAEVSLKTNFTRGVSLNTPVTSAAMDTVTEHRMAIAMAELGGIGVIHRSLSPAVQAQEVSLVKRFLNGRIDAPVTVFDDERVEGVLAEREQQQYPFHSFPVVSRRTGRLVGIVTKNDFDFCADRSLLIKEIMTARPVIGPSELEPSEAMKLMRERKHKILPLVDKDGKVTGMYVASDLQRILSGSSGHNTDRGSQLRVAAALGTREEDLERAKLLRQAHVDVIVIDTAHGDSKPVYDMLKKIKSLYPNQEVMVGNISEAASAKRLVDAGADGVKIGQGPGSICTTRIVAGIGRPQVSAVYECAKAIRGSGVPVCADGGIGNPGDVVVALGVGADSVMMGRILAGTDESPGETFTQQGRRFKRYRGMGSLAAMRESAASRDRYRQTGKPTVAEGIEAFVPYQGPVETIVQEYLGGLRNGMGYVGAANLNELHAKAVPFRISQAGLRESHPHDVMTMLEEPKTGKGRNQH